MGFRFSTSTNTHTSTHIVYAFRRMALRPNRLWDHEREGKVNKHQCTGELRAKRDEGPTAAAKTWPKCGCARSANRWLIWSNATHEALIAISRPTKWRTICRVGNNASAACRIAYHSANWPVLPAMRSLPHCTAIVEQSYLYLCAVW